MKSLDELDTMDKKMLDEINEISNLSHHIRLVSKKDLPLHRADLLQLMGQYCLVGTGLLTVYTRADLKDHEVRMAERIVAAGHWVDLLLQGRVLDSRVPHT